MLSFFIIIINLHGRVGDGLHFSALRMLGKIKLLAIASGGDSKILFVEFSDHHFPGDEKWLSTEPKQPLVEEMKEKTLHVLPLRLYAETVEYLNCLNVRHVAKHGHQGILKAQVQP